MCTRIKSSDGFVIHPDNTVWIIAKKTVELPGHTLTWYYPMERKADSYFFVNMKQYHSVFMFKDAALDWCKMNNSMYSCQEVNDSYMQGFSNALKLAAGKLPELIGINQPEHTLPERFNDFVEDLKSQQT